MTLERSPITFSHQSQFSQPPALSNHKSFCLYIFAYFYKYFNVVFVEFQEGRGKEAHEVSQRPFMEVFAIK